MLHEQANKEVTEIQELQNRLFSNGIGQLTRGFASWCCDGGDTLDRYPFFHSARADLLRREGAFDEARHAYQRALDLCTNEPERTFLQRRIDEVVAAS